MVKIYYSKVSEIYKTNDINQLYTSTLNPEINSNSLTKQHQDCAKFK
jgi:hypothetical protein